MDDANFYRLIMSRTNPLHPVIEWFNKIYSWAEIEETSAHFANIMTSLGCMKGDRVAVQVDKSPAALCLYLACLRAGLAFVPMNTAYRAAEVEYQIRDAQPTLMVVRPAFAAVAESIAGRCGSRYVFTLAANGSGSLSMYAPTVSCQPCPCAPDDIAAILYTSGTTGQPKGAVLSHRNLSVNGETLRTIWNFTSDDVLLHVLPIFHTHGLFVACHCALLSSARMIFLPEFDCAQVLAHLPRATVFMGVPTYYTRLLNSKSFTSEKCSNMRLFISGSAPLRPETFQAFQRRTGHAILERYGMTETGINTSNPYQGQRQPGRVGKPLPDVSVRVVGEDGTSLPRGHIGVLQVRGDNVFLGYWQQPKDMSFTCDHWFTTGDIACINDDDTISLVSRTSDLIISGGYNVYPQEIEQVINTLNGVVESAVIGLPHPDLGEAVVVVVQAGRNCPTTEALLCYVRARLANYKVPKNVVFVDELPRNVMGKVQKNLLRQTYTTVLTAAETQTRS